MLQYFAPFATGHDHAYFGHLFLLPASDGKPRTLPKLRWTFPPCLCCRLDMEAGNEKGLPKDFEPGAYP